MMHRSVPALSIVLYSAAAAASPDPGTLLPPTDPILVSSVQNNNAIEFSTTFAGSCGLVINSGNSSGANGTFNIYPPTVAVPDAFGFTPIDATTFTSVALTTPSGGSANTIFVGGTFVGVGIPCSPPFNKPVSRWLPGSQYSDSTLARADASGRVAEVFHRLEMMPNPSPQHPDDCNSAVTVGNNSDGPGAWPWFRRTLDCTGAMDINVVLRGVNVAATATAPRHDGTTVTGCLSYNHGGDGQTAYSDPFVRAPDGSQVVWLSAGVDQGNGTPATGCGSGPNAVPPLPDGRQIWRVAPYYPLGGDTALQPNIQPVNRLPANWHSRFTSTQPYLIGQRSTLFLASCECMANCGGPNNENNLMVVYSSRNGGKTFRLLTIA